MTLKGLKILTRLTPPLIGILIFLFFLLKSYIIVEPGEKAIIFNKVTGELRVTSKEGLFFLIPFLESATIYDIKVQTYNLTKSPIEGEIRAEDSFRALTSDGQRVFLDISVRFRLHPDKLPELHRSIGKNYIQNIVKPQIRNEVRIAASNFNVMELYTAKRESFQKFIEERLKNVFPKYNILMDSVLVRDVMVPDEFQKALESKHVAQQESERMKYVLEKEEKEKERKIIEAEGDAQAIKIKGQALAQNPAFIQYEYVQKIAPNVQAVITDGRSILSLADFLKSQKEK